MIKMPERFECACDRCKYGCTSRVGWFAPNQIKHVADFLIMKQQSLFLKYLAVDFWFASEEIKNDIFLIAPAIKYMTPGTIYKMGSEIGTCVFYQDDKCMIHPVKPLECALSHHSLSEKQIQSNHEYIAMLWNNQPAQDMVKKLYRKELNLDKSNMSDFFLSYLG